MTQQKPTVQIPRQRQVLLCVGPGGVGKTTVAAALGLREASRQRRVAVVTIDPSHRLAQALGLDTDHPSKDPIVRVPGSDELGHPLDCILLDTQRVFDEIVREYSGSPLAARRMLENPIYRAAAQHLGGALEYAAIARVHMLVETGNYDLIVLDTPPTANAIDFLDAPANLEELLNNPAARFMAASGRFGAKFLGLAGNVMIKAFEAIGGGALIGQLSHFMADLGAVLAEFHRRAGDVAALLRSESAGVILTTSATEFNLRETKAFVTLLQQRSLSLDAIVLNRVDPVLPPPPVESTLMQVLESALSHESASQTATRDPQDL